MGELRSEAETVAAGIRAVSNDNSNAAYGIANVSHAVLSLNDLKEYVRTHVHFKYIVGSFMYRCRFVYCAQLSLVQL